MHFDFLRDGLFLLVVFLSNIIQCVTGFAGTVLAMPFSVMLIGFTPAKAILNVLGAAASVGVVLGSRRHVNKKELVKILVFMLPGILAGFIFGRRLTAAPSLLYKLLGGIVIFFAVFNFIQLMRGKELRKPGKAAAAATLLAAGTVHGFFVCGGPLLVTYAAGQMPDTEEFRSTLSCVWIVLNSLLVFSDLRVGAFDRPTLVLLALSLVILIGAVFLGNLIKKHLSKKVFLILSYVLMAISGVSLFLK